MWASNKIDRLVFLGLVLLFIGCKKDQEEVSYEGKYTISLTTPFETRYFYPEYNMYGIYVGTDTTNSLIWRLEKINNHYLISPVSNLNKVVSYESTLRPVLIDRPASLTAKEFFKIEPAGGAFFYQVSLLR